MQQIKVVKSVICKSYMERNPLFHSFRFSNVGQVDLLLQCAAQQRHHLLVLGTAHLAHLPYNVRQYVEQLFAEEGLIKISRIEPFVAYLAACSLTVSHSV